MRRSLIVYALLPLLLVGVASCRKAASGGLNATITAVRVGIPPGPLVGDEEAGRREAMFKAGHWTPVLVTVEGKGKLEGADLVVQTVDSDDVLNEYAVKLPVFDFSAEQPSYSVVTYARPGKMDSPINVSLRAGGQSAAFPEKSAYALEPTNYLYATLGARLSGLRLPGIDDKHNRRSEIGALDRAADLPTRWLGYHTVDLGVLVTSNDEFMAGLLNDADRRAALVEWVRRGGKLVIAVSKNQSLLQNREDLKEFLPVDFAGTVTPGSVRVNWGSTVNDDISDPSGKSPLTLAKMTPKPDRGVRTLVSARATEGGASYPLVAQASYGLGRITVLALDPDQPPFTRWKTQGAFWQRLLNDSGPVYTDTKGDNQVGVAEAAIDDLGGQLQSSLETFEGVPVISFWWVALFILIYILIVGPLDYWFLKKVVKRLELTWVTFPIVVVVVSAAAYFTAYALKGNDQKVNKVDLIDIDLNTKTAQGTTWFSIFSPRVQNYTVGVEPAEGWGFSKDPISSPVVSWQSRRSAGRASLFRRSYDYDTSVGGLRRVPIQVWSTKGFQASWHHRLDPSAPPLTTSLQAVGDELTGSVTSHLPVELENVAVFYRDKVYLLDKLYPGAANRKQVTAATKMAFTEWAQRFPSVVPPPVQNQPRMPWGPQPVARPPEPSEKITRSLMFHEAYEHGTVRTSRNAGFRELDESWRIQPDDAGASAILYGTLPVESGRAADLDGHPGVITRLWLGALPGSGAARPGLAGTLRQETHLRFYVPVKK